MLKSVESLIRLGWSRLLLRPSVSLSVILLILVSGCCEPEIDCENEPQVEPDAIVDQFVSFTSTPRFSYNINLEPVGQRFVPSLYALDYVKLYLDDASCSEVGSAGGDVFVRIRKSSITGPVIGASNIVHFENCFFGSKEFQFPSYVALSPGKNYVIEVVYSSGNTSAIWVSLNPSAYSKGVFYLNGMEQPDKDMFFEEGIFYSLPRSKCDCIERLPQVLGPSGRPFKRVADCIRYMSDDDV